MTSHMASLQHWRCLHNTIGRLWKLAQKLSQKKKTKISRAMTKTHKLIYRWHQNPWMDQIERFKAHNYYFSNVPHQNKLQKSQKNYQHSFALSSSVGLFALLCFIETPSEKRVREETKKADTFCAELNGFSILFFSIALKFIYFFFARCCSTVPIFLVLLLFLVRFSLHKYKTKD